MKTLFIFCFLLALFLSLKQEAKAFPRLDTAGQAKASYTDPDSTDVTTAIQAGDHYLDARTRSTEKYLKHAAHVQQRLLKKLKKREAGMSALLAAKYPDLYAQYAQNKLTYDSLETLSQDSAFVHNKGSPHSDKLIDSLKGIQSFIQNQSSKLNSVSSLAGPAGLSGDYTQKLASLQQQLNAQQQLQSLIRQRSNSLNSLLSAQNIPGLASIQKNVAVAKAQMQSWKELSDDPDAAEEKAFEYLEGTEGFQKYLNQNSNAFGGLGNNPSAADLQRLGYQTKAQLSGELTQKFGDQLGAVQQSMAGQLQQYQDKLGDIKSGINEAKSDLSQAKQGISQLRQQGKSLQQPAFKNPMRGIPFIRRWKTQYNFQSTRAVDDRPAMLELGAALVYKTTPKWQVGFGASASMGMGRDWQHIRVTYEGVTARAFVDRDLIFGINLEGGYERIFRPANRPYVTDAVTLPGQPATATASNALEQAFGGQQQAAYLGLEKAYRINAKWNGTMMIDYNFLWQQYNMKSPLMIRLGWEK